MMYNVRVFFTKCGRLKYISHLDVVRLMQRVLKKTKLPIWYSEGFNPHMYITFALPLSLGYESNYEIMDFRVTEETPYDEIKTALNEVLPDGIEVFDVAEPINKVSDISSSEYFVEIYSKIIPFDELMDKLDNFLSQDEILVEKKTKRKGFKTIDIKPDIKVTDELISNDGITFNLILPAGERTINPSLVLDEFEKFCDNAIYLTRTKRTMIYDTELTPFK